MMQERRNSSFVSRLSSFVKVCSLRSFTIGLIFAALLNLAPSAFGLLYEDITALDLRQRMDNEQDIGYIILDIRDSNEYEEGHIPAAINIPLKELGYGLFSLDRTKDVIVYCVFGQKSKVACTILANAGFKDVYNLTDGFKGWSYSIEASDSRVSI